MVQHVELPLPYVHLIGTVLPQPLWPARFARTAFVATHFAATPVAQQGMPNQQLNPGLGSKRRSTPPKTSHGSWIKVSYQGLFRPFSSSMAQFSRKRLGELVGQIFQVDAVTSKAALRCVKPSAPLFRLHRLLFSAKK